MSALEGLPFLSGVLSWGVLSWTVLAIYIASTAGLLFAELRGYDRLKYIFKPLSGLIFLIVGLGAALLGQGPAQLICLGLFLSFVGDCALLKSGTGRAFAFGVGAFLLAHIAYGFGFALMSGLSMSWPLGLFVIASLAGLIKPLIWKSADKAEDMDRLISAYGAIIMVMTGLALYCAFLTGQWIVALAASLFVISDIYVSRNRFGPSSPWQFLIITPFYFMAQILFAISAG